MSDTPQAPVDAAAADHARELAQAISTCREAEDNLLNAVATGDQKLIADRGRGYVSAAREVGKLSSIIAGVPGDPTAQPGQVPTGISVADVERLVLQATAPLKERLDNICANRNKHLVEKGPDEEPLPASADAPPADPEPPLAA